MGGHIGCGELGSVGYGSGGGREPGRIGKVVGLVEAV